MNFDTKYILFTGAGFTANFGGFLADEMWCYIFNNDLIQRNPRLKEVMQDQLNFESALAIVQNRKDLYSDEDSKDIQKAVDIAFGELDLQVRTQAVNSEVNYHILGDFIRQFSQGQKGFFFTINLDLFVERFLFGMTGGIRPGIESRNIAFKTKIALEEWGLYQAPRKEEIIRDESIWLGKRNDFYIKLHGSQDWISSTGSGVKVIGGGKMGQIQNEPILDWYYDLFKKILYQNERKILIIGYGFRDEHINEVLIDGIKNFRLKVIVISPQHPKQFRDNLVMMKNYELWTGISKYYPYTLKKYFPKNGDENSWKDLARDLFGPK